MATSSLEPPNPLTNVPPFLSPLEFELVCKKADDGVSLSLRLFYFFFSFDSNLHSSSSSLLFTSLSFSPLPSPLSPLQSLGINVKEGTTSHSKTTFTRVMGFKPVTGGMAGPPELAGLLKEGDFFVGVSLPLHAPFLPP